MAKTGPATEAKRLSWGALWFFLMEKMKGFCLLALRGVEWDSKGFQLGSGCGLVESSILQREWKELSLKRDQIKKFFGLY